KRRPPREPSKEFYAKVVCFRCGKPGHLSRTCNENRNNGIRGTSSTILDPKPSAVDTTNDTLQTLLSLFEDKENEEETRDQYAFLNLSNDQLPLYLPAGRHEQEEAPIINDHPMNEPDIEANQGNENLNKVETLPNETVPIDKPAYQEKAVPAETSNSPIVDLLDSYYEKEAVIIKYNIGKNRVNFAWSSQELGHTSVVKHKIDTGTASAIKLRSYHHTPKEREFLKEEIIQMLKENIIQPSENLLEDLKGSSYFSTLDLASGYWQVRIEPQDQIKVLEHIVSQHGIGVDPKIVAAVADFPILTTLRQLRGFLGLALYYQKFVPEFTRIAATLNKLLKKGISYHWTAEEQGSFELLKLKLTEAPVLIYPNFEEPFILFTDASGTALGASYLNKIKKDTKELFHTPVGVSHLLSKIILLQKMSASQ
ncbi:272_t:CDS:2, partial [Gigaspora rosea]